LRDDDLGPAPVEFLDDPVGIKGFVSEQGIEVDALDQRRNPDGVVAVSGQQDEAHEIAQSIGKGQYLGRHPAF